MCVYFLWQPKVHSYYDIITLFAMLKLSKMRKKSTPVFGCEFRRLMCSYTSRQCVCTLFLHTLVRAISLFKLCVGQK